MTQVAGTTDSFDVASLKESLDSVIWDLFPMDTYFQNHIDKVEVGQPQHQWVFDTLAAAANNKQIQGDTFSYATAVTASRVSNYTQIARKAITISETLQASNAVGGSPTGREVMKKMKEYKRDVEFDLLGRQGSSAGATNTAAASGGVLAWIWGQGAAVPGNTIAATSSAGTTPSYASAAVAGQTDGTTAASSVTYTDVESAAELAWLDGGEPDVILCSNGQKKVVDAFTSRATRTADISKTDELTVQGAVNILVTSFGTFKVVMSRYIPRNCMVLLQMDKWAMGQLRPTKVIEPAQTADAKNKVIIGEYTLIARNPNSSAKVVDFKET
jgi:uncharacterized protein DUF5309